MPPKKKAKTVPDKEQPTVAVFLNKDQAGGHVLYTQVKMEGTEKTGSSEMDSSKKSDILNRSC